MKKYRFPFLIVFLVAISNQFSIAQSTFTSVQSGNWNNGATWGNTSPGTQGVDWPAATDNANISSGNTVTLAGTTLVRNLAISAGGILDDNNKQFTINGNLVLNGIITGKKSTLFSGGAGTTIDGTGVHNTSKDFIIQGSATVLSTANFTVINSLELTAGVTVTNNGSVTINTDLKGAASSTWINGSNSKLTVGKILLATGTLNAAATGNTVVYNRNNNQDIKVPSGSPPQYFNLDIEGTGTKTLLGGITVLGDLIINSSTLDTDLFNITIGGNFTNSGIFNENLNSVIFNGTGSQLISNSSDNSFYNLTVNKVSGTLSLDNDLIVSNTLDISNSLINTGANTLTLGTGTGSTGIVLFGTGKIVGRFERWISTGMATTDIEFPVGTSFNQRLALINFGGINTGGTVIFQFFPQDPGNNGLPLVDGTATIFNTFVDGYWDLQAGNAFDPGASTFNLDLSGEGFLGFTIGSETRLLTRVSGADPWIAEGTHVSAVDPVAMRDGLSTIGAQYAFGDNTDCTGPVTSAITGSTEVCTGDTNVPYSVTDNGNTYTWMITGGVVVSGDGTANITVDWGPKGQIGLVSVIENNTCTFGQEVSLAVNINSITPTSISGKTAVAEFTQGEIYSVEAQTGYSYTWNITGGNLNPPGQSSNTVSIDWLGAGTGNISVTAQKSGCSPAAPFDIDILKYVVINSVQNGNWGANSTWDTGTVPLPTESVRIRSGHTVTITGNEIINNIVIDPAGTLNALSSNKILTVNGDITVNGSYLGGTKALELNGVNKTISGIGTISITGANVVINSGNKTILSTTNLNIPAGNINVAGTNITITNNGALAVSGNIVGNVNGSSTWRNAANSNLTIGGSIFATGGILIASASGNTVEYNGTAAQNVYTPSSQTYFNLTASGINTKTLQSNLVVKGNITINGSTLSAGLNRSIFLSGNWIVNSGTFVPALGQVTLNGLQSQNILSGGIAFNILTVSGTGTKLLMDDMIVNGTLTINSMLDVSPGNFNLELGGDFINEGTFTQQAGRILLTGTADQSFSGSQVTYIHNMTFNKASGAFYIENDLKFDGSFDFSQPLTIYTNGLSSNGQLELISNSLNTGRITVIPAGSQLIGSIVVNRHLPNSAGGRFWRYFSAPLTGMTVSQLKTQFPVTGTFTDPSTQAEWPEIPGIVENSPSMYVFDETSIVSIYDEGWQSFPSVGTLSSNASLDPGRGYTAFVRSSSDEIVQFTGTGTLFDVPVNVFSSGPTGASDPFGWNLIGNPYPCSIDWDNVSIPAGVNNEIHLLDNANNYGEGAGTYITYVGGVGIPASYTGEIAMGQAFWVRATSNATITFQETNKITNNAQFLRMADPPELLRISLMGNNKKDETVIRFWPDATDDFDDKYDAHQLNLGVVSISSLLNDGTQISINSLNDQFCLKEVNLSMSALNAGTYNLNFSNLESFEGGMNILFHDAFQGTIINLFEEPEYTFEVNEDISSKGNGRFQLIFERIINKNIEAEYMPSICERDEGMFLIKDPQVNTQYFLTINGITISDTVISTNQSVNLVYDVQKLETGLNNIQLHAYQIDCAREGLVREIQIIKIPLPENPVTQQFTVCTGESIEIGIQPSQLGNTFLWFDNIESEPIIPIDTSLLFTTPPLAVPVSYWIAELNAEGCQSEMVEIPVSVIDLPQPVIHISTDGYRLNSSSETGNQWYLDGEILPGEIYQSIETVFPGQYMVKVTVGNCFSFSESYIQLISGFGPELPGRLHIYPNPVENILEIELGEEFDLTRKSTILIYDINGKIILTLSKEASQGFRTLNLTDLQPGLYLIKLIGPDGTFEEKFLKN